MISNKKGFTLVELVFATVMLGFALANILYVFVQCQELGRIAREKTVAMSLLQVKMEDFRTRGHADVETLYNVTAVGVPAETFSLAPLNGVAAVYISQFTAGNSDLLEIKIVGSWFGSRMFGEDLDLDGVEDTGEDADGDGDFSSIATVTSLIADKT